MPEHIDLREGYRIEVTPALLPADSYAAQLYARHISSSGRTTWKKAGPVVLDRFAAGDAATGLLTALNQGAISGVEAADGPRRSAHQKEQQ